ncbi:acyl-CoA dehydrogenase family protein [Dehalococcoidia bacterium]|nr:acyl-CoA dehydrogenase family protein [Dehalococcoidia bacterium]
MDFRFNTEDEAFRREVGDFLDTELPSDWQGVQGPQDFDFELEMRKKLAGRGWFAMAWPKEYGGGGAGIVQQMIYNEEIGYRRAPGRDGQGVGMIGPCIIVHGTDEQKKEHLSRTASADVVWCQGYSEPGAGSDLAGLQTRAIRDGDDYVISGQKVWTSSAHRAQWMHVLTRTDPDAPKHRGISYFLLDMTTPGINIRPLVDMTDGHHFNEVYFDNVRVPARNMLGEENRGWYVGTTTLDFERSAVGSSATQRRLMDDFIAYMKALGGKGRAILDDPLVRHKLADLVIDIQTARLHSYRIGWMQASGLVPNMEASMGKVFNSETQQKQGKVLMEILGMTSQLACDDSRAPIHGHVAKQYLQAVSITIAGGTSEIQRNIIATRGLGLPR